MKKASSAKGAAKAAATPGKSAKSKSAVALRDMPAKKSPVGGGRIKQEQSDK